MEILHRLYDLLGGREFSTLVYAILALIAFSALVYRNSRKEGKKEAQ